MHPVIGITARPQDIPASGGDLVGYVVTHTYTDSVLRGGGIPLLLPPIRAALIDAVLDRVDGIVLTGGGDVAPERYGEEGDSALRGVNVERDEFEISLVEKAYERRMPTMAICRGHQIVNVAFGGTLIQDIASDSVTEDHDIIGAGVYEPHSDVTIDDGSWIASILGPGPHSINSIHHQAIEQLGRGLRVVATAPDGTIEAVEHEDTGWDLLSVQWHPEYLSVRDHGDSMQLFAALIEAAAKFSTNT